MLHVENEVAINQNTQLRTNRCRIKKERSHSDTLFHLKFGLISEVNHCFTSLLCPPRRDKHIYGQETDSWLSTSGGSSAGQRSSLPCCSYRAPPFKNAVEIYPCSSTALRTATHPSCSFDGPRPHLRGTPPSRSASQNTHLCNQALGCRHLPSRFNLLRSQAASLSLLGMKSLMLYTYIECCFFFFFLLPPAGQVVCAAQSVSSAWLARWLGI